MQYRSLGQSGIAASVVTVGGGPISGWQWGGTDECLAIRTLHECFDAGINLVDTAPLYGLGTSESIVGKAIAGRRDKVLVATKCGLTWTGTRGERFFLDVEGKPVYRYLGPESIRSELENSLRRLGTDYVDLYQTHWQESTTPIESTMRALLDLKQEGKIRAVGVSNCTLDQLRAYLKLGPVDSVQEQFNLLDRRHQAEYFPFCRANHIAVISYQTLINGLLSGKIGPEREFPQEDLRHNRSRFVPEVRREVQAMLNEMEHVAHKYNLTTAQLVIAWTIAQPGVTHSLVGVRNVERARENAMAGSVILSETDLGAMDSIVAKHWDAIPNDPGPGRRLQAQASA
jgi:aryl-alcohol dehydrogenase-like predicted oxidoreductase